MTVVKRAVRLLSPALRRRLVLAVGASAVMAVIEAGSFALLFFLIRVLADDQSPLPAIARSLGATGDRDSFSARCGTAVAILFVVRAVGTVMLYRIQSSVQSDADKELAVALFGRYQTMPYIDFLQRNSADLIINVHRTSDVAADAIGMVVGIAADGAVLMGVGVTLLVVQPTLAVYSLAFLALIAAGSMRLLTPAIRAIGRSEIVETNRANVMLQESLSGLKAIKANDLLRLFADRFEAQRTDLARVRKKQTLLMRLPQFYLEYSLLIGIGVLVVVIVRSNSAALAPTLGTLVAAALRTLPSLSRVVTSIGWVRASESAVDAIENDLHLPSEPRVSNGAPGNHDKVAFTGSLRLIDVSLRYPERTEDTLSRVSLEITAGESIGLVGASGSGKTTLVDIVIGLLDPSQGRVVLDNEPLAGDRLTRWRHSLGYVPQDVFLLDATLRQNILFGRPDVDEEGLAEAIRLAQLEDVILGLPEGIDTEVGERGLRLSGGQIQRVGIARALLSRPAVLVLDEATASIDTPTEAAITRSIRGLHGTTTTVVVAHRLSTVQACDRIVFLEQGSVRSIGSFRDLTANDPRFEEFVRLSWLRRPESH